MSAIDYRLAYEYVPEKSDFFSILAFILSSLIFYALLYLIWQSITGGKHKKFGIALTVFYFFSLGSSLIDEVAKDGTYRYRIVEGEVSKYKPASYYNRRGGSFRVNGVEFGIYMSGIDSQYKSSLHFGNGRRVKIYYSDEYGIVKLWVENYRAIWEKACYKGDYYACFLASQQYQDDNRRKAQELMLKATESNESRYFLIVSKLYENGILFEKNQTKADYFRGFTSTPLKNLKPSLDTPLF